MTKRQILIELERRLQLIDNKLIDENKLSSDLLCSLINEAIDKFWKTRYSGLNYKQSGFEQTQKRIDDLRTLVRNKLYEDDAIQKISNSKYSVELPEDYNLLLGDTAGIYPADGLTIPCWEKINGDYVIKDSDTIESTIETVDRQLENPLSEHNLKYSVAKPLRLVQENNILLITDSKYKIKRYNLVYLCKPQIFKINTNPNEEYTDLPEHTHIELIKLAVQLYLSTKATNNYQIYSSEVATME